MNSMQGQMPRLVTWLVFKMEQERGTHAKVGYFESGAAVDAIEVARAGCLCPRNSYSTPYTRVRCN